jgi:hypothetical protein
MKPLFIFILLIFMSQLQAQEIKINKGIYASYYHMSHQFEPGKYTLNLDDGFDKGGQFEVLVPKEYFPVPAPYCPKNILIRMPSSHNLEKKKSLYDLLMRGSDKIDVVLELNPHFIGISTDPSELELLFCDVFFRHKDDDYYGKL